MSISNGKGDVFYNRGLTFPDENQCDIQLSRRPAIVLTDAEFNDDYIYFVAASSNLDKITRNPNQYVIIKNTKANGLFTPSIVNLENIFRDVYSHNDREGTLSHEDYQKLVEKFKKYQEGKDKTYYIEIKDKL